MNNHPHHHLHIRKRVHVYHQPYPHPNPKIRLIDRAVNVIAILGPLITIPQLIQILDMQSASNLSFTTWGAYTVFASIWLIYGIAHHETPIIISNALYLVVDLAILIAMIYYSFIV